MEYPRSSFVYLFTLFLTLASTIADPSITLPSSDCNATSSFIISECDSTHFSNLCVKYLVPFACNITSPDRQALCAAALNVTVSITENVLNLLQNISKEALVKANTTETDAINGCISDFGDSVNDIKKASNFIKANLTDKFSVDYAKDGVIAYTLGAISDEEICLDEIDGRVRADLKKKIFSAANSALKLKNIIVTLTRRL